MAEENLQHVNRHKGWVCVWWGGPLVAATNTDDLKKTMTSARLFCHLEARFACCLSDEMLYKKKINVR